MTAARPAAVAAPGEAARGLARPPAMALRVTRPGFINGIRTLKAHQGIPDYDPNRDASRQEMRSFVCGQCHVEYYFRAVPEAERHARVRDIQDRHHALLERAAAAYTAMLDAIAAARAAGAPDADLADAFALQRKAQWRLDFVAAENSMGFHAPQELARILAESIDYSRQAEVAAGSTAAPPAGGRAGR